MCTLPGNKQRASIKTIFLKAIKTKNQMKCLKQVPRVYILLEMSRCAKYPHIQLPSSENPEEGFATLRFLCRASPASGGKCS